MTCPPRPARAWQHEGPNPVGDAEDVDRVGPLPILLRNGPDAALGFLDADARIVEQQVHVAVGGEYSFREGIHRLRKGDIDLHAVDREPLARKLVPGLRNGCRVDIGDDHLGTVTRQLGRNGAPDAARASGDDRHLLREVTHSRLPFGREGNLDTLLRIVVSLNEEGLQPLARHRSQNFAASPRRAFG